MRKAAIVLQAQLRGHLARKEWKRKRDAVILLQAHTRSMLARKALKKRKRDVSSTVYPSKHADIFFKNRI